jgi:hypothetical protein
MILNKNVHILNIYIVSDSLNCFLKYYTNTMNHLILHISGLLSSGLYVQKDN